jgi:fructose-1,6-bisphosphatase I
MQDLKGITFDEFVIIKQKDFSSASGDLSKLLRDIALASKVINREVNKAGLGEILGMTGARNVQGEEVQKLDEYANEQMIKYMKAGGQCCAMGSEEEEDFIIVNEEHAKDAHYVVLFDPLDGSSNIDVNASIGTIFSIYRRVSTGTPTIDDILQAGKHQVAAGYVIYGSSTMLVYTTGNGVHGFTLDPSIGEFCLSHPNIMTPENGKIYSINEGENNNWPEYVKEYVQYCKENVKEENRPYSLRYIGSMVADLHRNLIKGGIFIYPPTTKAPKGKLRLLYECNPMAFLVEQAGGKATDATNRILDIQPTELHQRVPVFIGSKNMVEKIPTFIKSEAKA